VNISDKLFDMSKKISKKSSAIRTISIALGSLSLLLIAFVQLTEKEVCTSNAPTTTSQIVF
tara:strand:+ start:2434 stop:2616 length:183 start_codon:yes stop_codon:yes gene_type:complete